MFSHRRREGWIARRDTILPASTRLIYYTAFWDKNSRTDVFSSVIVDDMHNKHLIVISLSGDTIAHWNDSSIVLTDKKYWTIGHAMTERDIMDFYCILNLTDEVLKLK